MLKHYVQLARPHQWVKNAAVFVGPLFALKLGDLGALADTVIAFIGFCLVSGGGYAINDAIDREADALHPQKRHRPVASGAVSLRSAVVFGVLLCIAGVGLVRLHLPQLVTHIVAGYFVLVLAYSLALKRRPILDVIILAIGFVLRAVAGAAAVEATISPWLIVCTFTLCMFLGFGKRRCELATFDSREEAGTHRRTLLRYTPELLNHLISVSAGIAIITFLLYTMDGNPKYQPPFHKEYLLYTLPLVAYGLFRYAMLIEFGNRTGPTEIILKDVPLLLTIGLWGIITLAIVLTTTVG